MLRVLYIIENLGLASIEEVEERYKELFESEVQNCNLLVRRWKAKKAIVMEDGRYKIADVPPWFKSLRHPQLLALTKKESKEMVKELEEFFHGGAAPLGKKLHYADFQKLTLTFQNLDPILGGRPAEENDKPYRFPRDYEGNLIIPQSWLIGFIRDNQALINAVGLHRHIAWGKGYWEGDIKTTIKTAPVVSRGRGVGIAKYEAVPPNNKFVVSCRFPTYNRAGVDKETLKTLFDICSETPLRGLGANWKAYGGRIKLVEMKETS